MRPDNTLSTGLYGGASDDAWDPSDVQTPQTTMDRPWSNGTASNVAVRAIGPRGTTIRAYFDVRGPGILVNPSAAITERDDASGEPRLVSGDEHR